MNYIDRYRQRDTDRQTQMDDKAKDLLTSNKNKSHFTNLVTISENHSFQFASCSMETLHQIKDYVGVYTYINTYV